MESLNLSDAVKDLKEVDDPIYIGTGPTPFVVNPAGPGGFFKFQIRYGLRCHREKPYPVKRISTTKGLSFFLRVSAKLPLFVSVQEEVWEIPEVAFPHEPGAGSSTESFGEPSYSG
ncbi:hypothetical protein RIF29_43636 [Crotalaria pallida]|uniref:Uncharacterized protein n=1 Tax=Crotalaria pallida TaxID=3830 RepID=A0AAN9DYE9_CROPI